LSETSAEKSGNPTEEKPKLAETVTLFGRQFDLGSRSLKEADGTPIPLRAQSAEVLALLVTADGSTVLKDDIIGHVWPDTFVTEDSLVKCIADIRRALGDTDRTRVQTLPKIGYRLYVPNEGLKATRARKFGAMSILVGIAALFAVTLWAFWPMTDTPALPDKPRIAVLAFDDFSTGEDQGFLSDAIAEGLITELARFPTFAVISRTSSFSYRDTKADIETIRDELRVHYVLEGSQQKSGDGLKLTTQLIDARSGAHVWTETYDRQISDLFTMQEEIVRAVVGIVADIVEVRPLPESDLNQVTALGYFLEASGDPDTRETVEARFALGKKAVEIDPDSPWGYLIYGWTHRHMAVFFSTPAEKQVHLEKAEKFADKAVAIAPGNYFGYWLRARVQVENGDHVAATETYRQASALNPSASNMLVGSSEPLLYLGRFEEGLAVIDRALDLDPKHTGWFHWQRAWALWELNRCAEALASFQRMAKIPGGAHRMLAATHACLGQKTEAIAALNVFLADNPDATLAAEAEKLRKTWPNPPSVERWLKAMEFAGMPS
jgi:TolB-like protein/DNA-binding winged helix-turn-helix (wHTH) protein